MRQTVSSGSPLEAVIGFSRAVRIGSIVAVSGTAPIASTGGVACAGDVYGQTKRCLEIAVRAVRDCGCDLESVVRTRVLLLDADTWREAARAHGEFFATLKPACTFVEVSRFIDPAWLVEIEMDCVVI
jgi:enamine deaminase RidA (YjgF/YER057c/UK114 family)